MSQNYSKHEEYKQAEKKVKAIKGFYINLFIYFITNLVLVYISYVYSPNSYWVWYSVLPWGAVMLLYGMIVFRYIPFMNHNWEEQKLKELIEKQNGKEEVINTIKRPLNRQIQYDRTKKRVRALRDFYRHLMAYIIVSILLLTLFLVGLQTEQDLFVYIAIGTALGWTIGLIIHTFRVFGVLLFMGKNWEDRKLTELIEEDKKKL